jgi:hypothetical protein
MFQYYTNAWQIASGGLGKNIGLYNFLILINRSNITFDGIFD